MNPLISIIIPVYNAERNLPVCLASLGSQTYDRLELIFVNDACTDGSVALIEDFAAKQSSPNRAIKILNQPTNRGVAAARNLALDNATGEYVYSIDSDDYIDSNAIESMVNTAMRYNSDIVGIDWNLTYSTNERRVRQGDASTGIELFKRFTAGVSRWNLWLWMIRRSILEDNNFRFTPGQNMGEDLMIMLKVSLNSNVVSMIHEPYYHYIQTNDNALTKRWSNDFKSQIEANVADAVNYVMSRNDASRFEADLMRMKLNIKLPLLISTDKNDYKAWQAWFPEANAYIKTNSEIPFRTKLLQIAAAKQNYWFVKLYNIIIYKLILGKLYK